MRIVEYGRPVFVEKPGEVFQLPIPHTYIRWGGVNHTFGHRLSLVYEHGNHVDDDSMVKPFATRMRKCNSSEVVIDNHVAGTALKVYFTNIDNCFQFIVNKKWYVGGCGVYCV